MGTWRQAGSRSGPGPGPGPGVNQHRSSGRRPGHPDGRSGHPDEETLLGPGAYR